PFVDEQRVKLNSRLPFRSRWREYRKCTSVGSLRDPQNISAPLLEKMAGRTRRATARAVKNVDQVIVAAGNDHKMQYRTVEVHDAGKLSILERLDGFELRVGFETHALQNRLALQ